MRKLLFSILLVFSFLITSCATDVLIPGRKASIVNNIYQEYMNIGDVYSELKRYDKAIEYYKKASESRGLYWGCVYKLADTYLKQGNFVESEIYYIKLQKRDSDNSDIKQALAYIYASTGKFDQATVYYEEIEKLFPESQVILENYIVVLISNHDFEKAKEKIEELLVKFPDNTKAKNFLDKIDSEEKAAANKDLSENETEILEDLLEEKEISEEEKKDSEIEKDLESFISTDNKEI